MFAVRHVFSPRIPARALLLLAGATAAFAAGPANAHGQAVFTYQGQLKQDGAPVTDGVDLDCSLWDADVAGNQIGGTVSVPGVFVNNGLFTVPLDFGVESFDGNPRWLEITVNGTTLSPRQELTASPHATTARRMALPYSEVGNVEAPTPMVSLINQNTGTPLYVGGTGSDYGVQVAGGLNGLYCVGDDTGAYLYGPSYGVFTIGDYVGVYSIGGTYGLVSYSESGTAIYASTIDGVAAQFDGKVILNGNVGVGTTDPQAKLHIAGEPGVDGLMFPDGTLQTTALFGGGDSVWSLNGPDTYYTAGKVGVGTSEPMAMLHVAGVAGTDGIMFPDGTLQTTAAVGGGGGGDSVWSLNGSSAYYNAGKVGIGRNNPPDPLSFANLVGDKISLYGDTGGTFGFGIQAGLLQIHTNNSGGDVALGYGPSASFTERMRVRGNGNVGIGTSTPQSKLDITAIGDGLSLLRLTTDRPWNFRQAYTGSGTALRLQPETGLKNFEITAAGGFNVATFVGNDADPRVGVGTTAPDGRLHVYGGQAWTSNGWAKSLNLNNGAAIELGYGGSTRFGIGASSNGLYFFTTATDTTSAAASYFMTVNASGNVGIGTTTPTTKLDVNGTTKTKVLQITGADLAEKFPTSGGKVDPGTVMEIDPENPGTLRMARGAYNQRVAGVVSGANDFPAGAILGHMDGQEDAPPIALSGRVWTKCDAGESAISPGDLLTTSETAGHAMKAADRDRSHGTVIGKAMTSLAAGERGLVLVLVNLQ